MSEMCASGHRSALPLEPEWVWGVPDQELRQPKLPVPVGKSGTTPERQH